MVNFHKREFRKGELEIFVLQPTLMLNIFMNYLERKTSCEVMLILSSYSVY